MLPNYVCNGELERFGIGGYRFQHKGEREVVVLDYIELVKYLSLPQIRETLQCSTLDTITKTLSTLDLPTAENLTKYVPVYRGTVLIQIIMGAFGILTICLLLFAVLFVVQHPNSNPAIVFICWLTPYLFQFPLHV